MSLLKRAGVLFALTVVNLALLIVTLARQAQPAVAHADAMVLRGRALETVDDKGRVRASLGVLPAGESPDGAAYAETVLLRLNTECGRPSVKIGASEHISGLSFAGPTGTNTTYAILQSDERASSLQLRNEDGQEQIVRP